MSSSESVCNRGYRIHSTLKNLQLLHFRQAASGKHQEAQANKMTNYPPYQSSYSYPQPQGNQRRQAQQHDSQPPQYRSAPYATPQPPQRYDQMRHVPYGQQYAPAPAPPPPNFPAHATYSTPYHNEYRDIRGDMRDMRDIHDIDFAPSFRQPAGPPAPPVPTSDAYAPPPPPPPGGNAMMAGPALVAQGAPTMYWGPPAGDTSAQRPPPPPQAPPGRPPPPPQSRPLSQTDVNAPQQYTFNEEAARTTASATFDRFDQDRGNYLDLQEFMDALRALHLAITYHDAMDCFARADHNRDGRITKEEFIKVYIEEMGKTTRY